MEKVACSRLPCPKGKSIHHNFARSRDIVGTFCRALQYHLNLNHTVQIKTRKPRKIAKYLRHSRLIWDIRFTVNKYLPCSLDEVYAVMQLQFCPKLMYQHGARSRARFCAPSGAKGSARGRKLGKEPICHSKSWKQKHYQSHLLRSKLTARPPKKFPMIYLSFHFVTKTKSNLHFFPSFWKFLTYC